MRAILANPRGFCAGVIRAIEIVEQALEVHGAPVYVLHEIVHNQRVVEDLRGRGARFVESLDEVPRGAVTVLSAHGVPRSVHAEAEARDLRILDATCPLVTKVHRQARAWERRGLEIVIVGHKSHVEVEGHKGQVDGPVHVVSSPEEVERLEVRDPQRVAYVTQTTLSLDDTRAVILALERRFPGIRGPGVEDICYATQNRQNAVSSLAGRVDVLLVVGAENSSNSNRLRELGEQHGVPSHLIPDASALDPSWFTSDSVVGITAGASAPEELVREVVSRLREWGMDAIEEMNGQPETVHFALPDIALGRAPDSV